MTRSAIICDWNGTLYEDVDEEAIVKAVIVDLAKSYIPSHPFKFARLIKIKNELEILNRKRNQGLGNDRMVEVLQAYSEKLIKGVPMSMVRRLVEKYANRRDVQNKIVLKVLRPVAERHRAGITTGILSAGYSYGIQMILKSAGYGDCFDFYKANLLTETEDRAIGFTLSIYKNKADLLLKLMKDMDIDPQKTAYLGDSLDDVGCFEVIGHPIVSFLTPEALKQKFAREYRAFIPEDEADLARYFKNIQG
jgi:phosphoglycolate phosphatase-like HAD superfamily hydrolase